MNKNFPVCFLIFVFFCVGGKEIYAQSFSYKNYSALDGLSSSLVYSCCQDSNGYIWFCTDAGVSRFDGKQFELFTRSDGLSDNEVFQCFQDSKQRIWFLTFNGHICYYLDGKFYNEENTPFLKRMFLGESYTTAFEDSKQTLYFGLFSDKIIRLDADSILTTMSIAKGYGTFSFYENKTGEVYVSSIDTLRFRIKGNELILAKSRYIRKDVRYISSALGNECYFSKEGLIRISQLNDSIIIPAASLPHYNLVTGIRENQDSSFLITTRGFGALLIKGKLPPDSLLRGKIVLSSYVDNEKNTWLNTAGNGTYMLPANYKNIKNYSKLSGLANENINRIIPDSTGSLWLACGERFITKITSNSIYNYHLTSSQLNRTDRALDLVFDNQQSLWIATDNGTFKFGSDAKHELVLINDIKSQNAAAKSISISPTGEIYLTLFTGVAKLERKGMNGKDAFRTLTGLDFTGRVFTHFLDHANRLWVTTIHGLNLWKDGKLISFGEQNELLRSRIIQIREHNNTLFLCTDNDGIILFRDNKIVNHLTKKHGLPSEICRKIFIREDKLWIGTNQGVVCLAIHNDSDTLIKSIDVSDGLISNDVHDVYDDGKKIYVATDKGLSILSNAMDEEMLPPPPLMIKKVLVNNQLSDSTMLVDGLSHKQNSIRIDFIAITFQNPDKVTYQYVLNNHPKGWTNTNNNSIEFSNLAPGNYVFKLRAKKINSDWSNPVVFNFRIHPPFWKSGWFIFLLTLVLLAILIWIQNLVAKRKIKEQLAEISKRELILQERSRISSDMHDDLGSDLSKLVVLSEVIQVSEKLNEKTVSNLNKMSTYAIDVREKIDEIIWALNPRHDSLSDLISYMHRFALDYFENSKTECRVFFPDSIADTEVSAAFRRNVFLIVKESLHNVVRHANAANVEVSITLNDHALGILVKDDGNGFDLEKSRLEGNGISNMKKRARQIGCELNISTMAGKGCEVKLICPAVTKI